MSDTLIGQHCCSIARGDEPRRQPGGIAMLDQPIALITALRTLLADWEHSRPTPRRAVAPPAAAG